MEDGGWKERCFSDSQRSAAQRRTLGKIAASINARRTGTHGREFAVGEDGGMHASNHYYYATELLWRLIIHIDADLLLMFLHQHAR
jgi:hypothetical protein